MTFPELCKDIFEEKVAQSITRFERKFVTNPFNYAIDDKGYIYCKKCGERVQTTITAFGKTYIPFCTCACDNEED